MSAREIVRIDWSQGPVKCRGCEQMLRPRGRKSSGVWAGTVRSEDHGRCGPCYRAELREQREAPAVVKEADLARSEFLWRWLMVMHRSMPRAHMEVEAMADLMDHLRAMGWALASRPERVEDPTRPGLLQWRVEVVEMTTALRRALEGRPPTAVISGQGRSWVFSRPLLSEGVPLVHQEMDIVADAAAALRERGTVAAGPPERRPIAHGLSPVMRVRVPVRPASAAEVKALARAHGDVTAVMAAGTGAEEAA